MINEYFLNKMGWSKRVENLYNKKIWTQLNNIDLLIIFFIIDFKSKKCYAISELNKENIYKFIVVDFKDKNSKLIKEIEFKTNVELLKLIIKWNACSRDYQRYLNINRILKK
jgi:hypothetical protein